MPNDIPDLIEEARLTAQDLKKIHPSMLRPSFHQETAKLLERLADELDRRQETQQ